MIEQTAVTTGFNFRRPWGPARLCRHPGLSLLLPLLFLAVGPQSLSANGDGKMDDLNRDGRSDYADAHLLGELIERLLAEGRAQFPGGLGLYEPNPAHGPFVHLDTRGFAARWAHSRSGG